MATIQSDVACCSLVSLERCGAEGTGGLEPAGPARYRDPAPVLHRLRVCHVAAGDEAVVGWSCITYTVLKL
jgi:hypothetical protein